MMILFGGGDGGGIYIDANGRPHRIPPWSPDVMAQLKAANVLTTAAQRVAVPDLGKEMSGLAERLTGALVPQLAKGLGGIAPGENTVAFVDGDGGFTCGSTGKHPIPFPVPHGFTRGVTAGEGAPGMATNPRALA